MKRSKFVVLSGMRVDKDRIEAYAGYDNKMYMLLEGRDEAVEIEYETEDLLREDLAMMDRLFYLIDYEDDDDDD